MSNFNLLLERTVCSLNILGPRLCRVFVQAFCTAFSVAFYTALMESSVRVKRTAGKTTLHNGFPQRVRGGDYETQEKQNCFPEWESNLGPG